jgi:hypothetical protein
MVVPSEDREEWIDPTTLPPNLSQLDRAVIAARNIRRWADWLLEAPSPAPERGDQLVDVGEEKDSS